MNKARRDLLRKVNAALGGLLDNIHGVRNEEEYAMDSMPENLQNSCRYEDLSSNVDDLYDIEDSIGDLMDQIDKIIAR